MRKTKNICKTVLYSHTSVMALFLGPISSAFAQDETGKRAANYFGDDFIVTAQKREQDINDVGIAVTAFSQQQIEDAKFENTADVFTQVPGAVARRHVPSRGSTTNLFIRGVGQTDANDGTESSVAPYIDEFYLINPTTTDSSTYDVQRIEVLRGPQGTVFGRNATGGAVQTVTNKPTEEFEGSIKAGAGNYDKVEVEGVLNIPLSDTFQLRLSGVRDSHGPFVENIFPGGQDALSQTFTAYRGQLRIAANDDLTFNLKYEETLSKGAINADQGFNVAGQPDGDIIEIPVGVTGFDPVALGVDGPDVTSQDALNDGFNDIRHGLWRADWDLGRATLTAVGGVLEQHYRLFEDCDGRPLSECAFTNDLRSTHWSQEVRLTGVADRISYTAGVYYLGQEADNLVALGFGVTPGDMTTSGLPESSYTSAVWNLQVRSFAAFAQAEYELTDQLTFILGGRINNDRKEFEQVRDVVSATLPAGQTSYLERNDFTAFLTAEISGTRTNQHTFTTDAVGDLTVQEDTNWSGTVQLDYRPSEDLLIYLSARRGIKAAGFNNGLVDLDQSRIELIAYDQEVLHAFEGGWKWRYEWGGAYGQFNGSVFYYDYQDHHATAYVGVGFLIGNNDATSKGFELEWQIVPTDGWFIGMGGSYFDGAVQDVGRPSFSDPTTIDPSTLIVADRRFGEAPEFTFNALVRHEFEAFGADWRAQLDYSFTDERELDVQNQTATRLDELHMLNGSVSTNINEDLTLSVWARNITEYRRPINTLAVPGFAQIGQLNWNEPRSYGVSLGYRF